MPIWQCEIIPEYVSDIARSMNRRQLFLASGIALVAAGLICVWLFGQSAYERAFDENLAHFPLAASLAGRDPDLRNIFLRRTEEAFNKGGWRAANGALKLSLATEVVVYADDEHVNAISHANLAVLLKLENKPLACKAHLFAGGEENEFPEARQEVAESALAFRAAVENGFNRKMSGINWTRPNDEQTINVYGYLSRGPIAALTHAELTAVAKYLDGDAELLCSASIKKSRNLLAMDGRDAAHAERILIANTSTIDLVRVLSKLCRDERNGLACS
jgi:hypothetical protein